MWTTRTEHLEHGRIVKFAIEHDASPLPYCDALSLLQHDKVFRMFFMALLSDAPYSALRWETPPINNATATRPFEFVVLDSPGLAKTPDAAAFATHFASANDKSVLSFRNLGNDALLIVPCPQGPATAYGHVAAFVREAPEEQRHALWQLLGEETTKQIGPSPLWLSTAGAGVPWLHVRLDATPKYYGYSPYRKFG